MTHFLKPKDYSSFDVESFDQYRRKLSSEFDKIPDAVIETWIYRHWSDFQDWIPLNPLDWKYSLVSMTSVEIMQIAHVDDWRDTLKYWGNDLLDGQFRKNTWLGKYLLNHGTTPAPIIVAVNAGNYGHPRENGIAMKEPYQIIEGHMRLSYLQTMIRRKHPAVLNNHEVFLAYLPNCNTFHAVDR